jgi:glycine cleavage system H lipoate-binding protein
VVFWLALSPAGTVGISKYAADALGDVVYAQLPEAGDSVSTGEVPNHYNNPLCHNTTI